MKYIRYDLAVSIRQAAFREVMTSLTNASSTIITEIDEIIASYLSDSDKERYFAEFF